MKRSEIIIFILVAFAFGFTGGFVLRPTLAPLPEPTAAASPFDVAPIPAEARGMQYFTAHIDVARQLVAGCQDGSVRSPECATAGEAIIKVDAEKRRRRFLGN